MLGRPFPPIFTANILWTRVNRGQKKEGACNYRKSLLLLSMEGIKGSTKKARLKMSFKKIYGRAQEKSPSEFFSHRRKKGKDFQKEQTKKAPHASSFEMGGKMLFLKLA